MMKQNTLTFDNLVNTMMPLPFSGNANGEGIYCRGEALLASMEQPKSGAVADTQQKRGFDLTGVFCQYCFD
ncbi:hypothetical protein [uncultured Megasphaera sp.]|uniref:hypothetical protein n=1 Tax=uncultured Megasphaera sp. TaxID=165188 RepID=UPI00265A8645|nr:hypothetical protein [uncultured Megasphaera sp.]